MSIEPLWRDQTWPERCGTVFSWILAIVFGLALWGLGIIVFGEIVDGVSRYKSEHNRCLQQATNGLEMEECR